MLEFLSQPVATNLVARDTIKEELSIAGSAADSLIDRLIASATARIVGYCNRTTFGSANVRETFYHAPRECRPFWLSHGPATAFASVSINDIALSPDEYELQEGRQLYRKVDGLRVGWECGKLVVEYTGGYTLPASCPPDLQRACINIVRATWFDSKRDPMVKVEDIPGVLRQEFWVGNVGGAINGMPLADTSVLDRYTNIITG